MSKDYRRLWNAAIDADDDGSRAIQILIEILSDREGRIFITNLEDKEDARWCMEILDNAIAERKLNSKDKQAFLLALRRLAGAQGRLPESMTITDNVDVERKILASGGFADMRRGTYLGHSVAVKTLRVTEKDDVARIRKEFCKEVILWSTLNHPNVVKFYGVDGIETGEFVTVSEWMEHGNITEYIKKYPINRLDLLHDAAQGLKYLHGVGLSHGDLKGWNILISSDTPPRACLADFNFMTMVLDPVNPMSCSVQLEGGTKAFMSPELLVPSEFGFSNSIPTPQADIYAFGMVIFQVLTGKRPFQGMRDTEIAWLAVKGLRPKEPENASAIGFSDPLWDFVQRCWSGNMKLRPQVADVVVHLGRAAREWDRPMPPHVPIEGSISAPQDSVSTVSERILFPPGSPAEESLRVASAEQEEKLHYPHIEEIHQPSPKKNKGSISKHLFSMFTPASIGPRK